MLACLDTNVIIYLVERNPAWHPRVAARLAALRTAGGEIAVSDVARLECLVGQLISGDAALQADYAAFFADPAVHMLTVTVAVWERPALIRAAHRFAALDSLHLATAVEHGCSLFLTNDAKLGRFPDIPVEVL